jgi:AhpD family alkylhydroperoxidase
MNDFTFPSIDAAHPDARPAREGPQKHLGFVPNLLAGLSNSPATLASYAELGKNFAKVGLTGVEMQTVLVVTSVENACAYCVAAHSTFATKMQIDPAVLKALRQGTDPPDAKLGALASFVRTLVRGKGHVSEADLGALGKGMSKMQAQALLDELLGGAPRRPS